jgi:WD40 repeat protein
MKNNQAPKDLVKLTSEPPVVSNEYFLILVCKRQIFRCELKMSFETDPENRNIARPVCDLVKTALPLPDEEYTTAECLPARLLAAATANGSILLYNIATSTLISRLEVPGGGSILTLLPTTLHLIAVREMKDEPNQLYLYELNDENSTIRFAAETPAKVYNFKKGKIRDVFFNQAFEHMFTLCEDGSFWDLPIKAEKREEIDDEDADKKVAKPVQTINADPELLGFFHCSKVIFCDEIKDTNKVVSVSVNGLVLIHNMDNGKLVANMKFNAVFTAADIGRMGNILVLATNAGVLRAIDLSDLKSPRLIYCRKLHKSKSIRVARLSGDQKYIAVVFEESSKVYFLSGLPSEQFQLYGYTTILQGTVLDGCWSGPTITPQSFTSVSKNGLLVTISFNEQVPPVRVFKEIPHDLVTVKSRKIDYDINLVAVEHDGGDVYCTGEEKTVRRYKQPEELIQDMDSRARAPFAPIDEVDGQDLGTTYFRVKAGTSLLVSGGNEGTCIIRSTNVPTEMQTINCQNNMNGGVSACSISESRKLLIAGGNDGSLLVFKYGTVDQGKDSQNRLEGVTAEQDTSNAAEVVSEPDSSLQFYEVVLEQQTRAEREGERNALHQDLKNQLRSIQEELNSLLQANEQADPIQKIERDEFCLDLEMKDQMLRDGDQEVERIKKNAYNLNLQEELLHKKINQTTYSKLDNHLKTITGLSDPILIFNFVTRKKEKMENDRYRMISNLRQVELTEKKWRKENKMDDIIDLPSLIGLPEQYKEYIDMNNKAEMDMRRDTRTKAIGGDPEDKARRRNMPEDHTDERGKRADLHSPTHHDRKKRLIDPVLNNPQRDREIDEERKRMEADQQAFLQNYPDAKAIIYKPENFICNLQSAKQRMLLLDHAKREEERLKTKAAAMDYDKKTDNQDTTIDAPDRPPATGYRLHRMSRNPRGRKKQGGAQMKDDDADENQTDSSDQEAEVDDEGKQDWDNMYGAFELFTTKRKRSQVMFLKNIIFKIKKSFNREFEAFFKNRTKQIEWINEQNILIQELLGRLEKVEENFKPALNIIEKYWLE